MSMILQHRLADSDRERLAALPLEEKAALSRDILAQAVQEHGPRLAACWTGGKDSTLMLWLLHEACRQRGLAMPPCVFIEEGDTFPEILEFVERLRDQLGLELHVIANRGLLAGSPKIREEIPVASLDPENRACLEELGFHGESFPFEPESEVGTHLTKTAPLRRHIAEHGLEAVLVALRWDEHPARAQDQYLARRHDPDHLRIQPILHFRERNVWDLTRGQGIPFCKLYARGYRSLGAQYNTRPVVPGAPAWEQDLENTSERQGRGQEKERMMEQLRTLGYM